MQISVSSTLTVYHDGQFWVGLAEHVEDGTYGVARIVFGAEPSDEEILQFVISKWAKLAFFGDKPAEASEPARNPKRRARETSRALKQPAMGRQGAAGARESAGGNETGVGTRKKPTPRGRGGGAFRAAEAEAQAKASWALIAICGDPYIAAGVVPIETTPAIYAIASYRTLVLLLFNGSGFVVPSFQLRPIFRGILKRVSPANAMSFSVGFGDKSRDNLKNSP